jgi:hypothetical protein
VARAKVDADLAPFLTSPATDAAIRYREVDSWQELARATGFVQQAMNRAAAGDAPPAPPGPAEPPPEGEQ